MDEFDKVDRALEMQVIDWLQWSEFPENIGKRPDDSDMAQLTLTLLSKRKEAFKKLREENERLKKLVEDYKHKLFNVADPYADKLESENEWLKKRNAELINVLEYLDCNHATSRPFCDVIKKALAKNEGKE